MSSIPEASMDLTKLAEILYDEMRAESRVKRPAFKNLSRVMQQQWIEQAGQVQKNLQKAP